MKKQIKHNFPTNIRIFCEKILNKEQTKSIFKLCIDRDIEIQPNTMRKPVDEEFPYLMIDNEIKLSQCNNRAFTDEDYLVVSHQEFINFFHGKGKYEAPFKQELDLNDKYTAVVTKDKVVVGCQEFNHEAIKKLYQLTLKAKREAN